MAPREYWDEYGCRCNAYAPAAVFAAYERWGFLYPAKKRRLASLWGSVEATWRAAMTRSDLMAVATCGDLAGARAATGMRVRSGQGYVGQHWAAADAPSGTLALTLAVLAGASARPFVSGFQLSYRPGNRMPARVFGGAVRAAGPHGAERLNTLHALPRQGRRARELDVARWAAQDRGVVAAFCRNEAGVVWTAVNELDTADVEWRDSDRLWAEVGLRYRRSVWVARWRGEIRGLAVVHRGPVGLNFSLLENRVELLLARDVGREARAAVAGALLEAATEAADPKLLNRLPVVCAATDEPALAALGAPAFRRYVGAMWAGPAGVRALWESVHRRFGRVLQRLDRQESGS
ncbi:MAG: hypothetical protein AAF628_30355 [Planctomycetota bacterium]